MAEGDDSQEKTEEPTQRRRDEARDDGKIVTSKEVFVLASITLGTFTLMAAPGLLASAQAGFAATLALAGTTGDLDAALWLSMSHMASQLALVGLGMGGLALLAVLVAQAAMGGLHFAPKALSFKASRINPGAGLKRMVSMQALVELTKGILKITLLGAAAAQVVWTQLPRLSGLWDATPEAAALVLAAAAARMMGALAIVLAVIAGLDLAWQAYRHRESLMMTRQEVRDDAKNTDGNPQVKGRMRQLQAQASRRAGRERASLADVGKATAIITNPSHFAVALRYVPGEMTAPLVVAMARGPMALELRKLAARRGIGQIEEPPLARALYFTGDIGTMIDVRLFAAVAVVLAHLHRLDHGEASSLPDIILPEDMRFDAFGRREGAAP